MWEIMSWIKYIFTPLKNKLIVALLMVFLFPVLSFAAKEMPRKVLVFYNSADNQTATTNPGFHGFQTILNYYGLLTEYLDIKKQNLPDEKQMSQYRGIVTVFRSLEAADATRFLPWLEGQFTKDRKLVMLGNPAINGELDKGAAESLRKIYARLGLVHKGGFTKASHLIQYKFKDAQMVEFERKYPLLPPEYEFISLTGKSVKAHLILVRTDMKKSESSVITTNEHGGFASAQYIYWVNLSDFRMQWYINPFLFIRESMGISGMPAPDPTTLNSVRVGFSHVDADGFSGLSKIGQKLTTAEVMLDKVFKIYPFPITVSVIVAEIDPQISGTNRHFETAREIYKLKNVEPASHSFSHPYYWEASSVNKDRYETQLGYSIRGYTFNDQSELDNSVKYITSKLSPPKKPCRVFQWTGECRPVERQIARLDALKVMNINGGDTILDGVDNSYTRVAPLYRQVGKRIQVHIGQANDNILTNNLTGALYAYRNIITTMERTETPYRLKPVDIYYHFFSAEKQALLQAVKDVYEWALQQDLALVFTSQYLQMMQGFISARIYQEGHGQYLVKNYGQCLTFRFAADAPAPDMKKSKNVLGYNRLPQGLYVSLVPGTDMAVIVLGASATSPALPYLKKANGLVTSFAVKNGIIRIEYEVFNKCHLEIAGLPGGKNYQVTGTATNNKMSVRSSLSGVLQIVGLTSGRVEIKGL